MSSTRVKSPATDVPTESEISTFAGIILGVLVRSGSEIQPNEECIRLLEEARKNIKFIGDPESGPVWEFSKLEEWMRQSYDNWQKVMSVKVRDRPLLYHMLFKNTEDDHDSRAQVVVSLLRKQEGFRKVHLMDGHGRFLHALLKRVQECGLPLTDLRIRLCDVVPEVDQWHRTFLPYCVTSEHANILHVCCDDCGVCDRCGQGVEPCSEKASKNGVCKGMTPDDTLVYLNFQSIRVKDRGTVISFVKHLARKGHKVLLSMVVRGAGEGKGGGSGAPFVFRDPSNPHIEVHFRAEWNLADQGKIKKRMTDGASGVPGGAEAVNRWLAGARREGAEDL